MQISDYCRQIETYLCQKNDGHLVRVVGPSFEVVSGWAERGVPLKVALRGIDRYFERYYRKGPRRRPVKIDYCDADVLDVFDEWLKAVGLPGSRQSPVVSHQSEVGSHQSEVASRQSRVGSHQSLPAHLERVVLRLTSARVRGTLGAPFDELIDRVARELDAARAKAGGVRGDARQALIDRLAALDAELLDRAQSSLDDSTRAAFERDADEELAGYRAAMTPDAFARARAAATVRLVREQCGLPVIAFE
ncbi:MAG TPA: hypothetical protein VG222_10315 [Vicinamibacterales bacterium]|nr:hypothetical protein [Vicinamibacterales bacterium]